MDVGREGYSVDARVIGVPPRVLKSTPPSKGVNKAKSRIDAYRIIKRVFFIIKYV